MTNQITNWTIDWISEVAEREVFRLPAFEDAKHNSVERPVITDGSFSGGLCAVCIVIFRYQGDADMTQRAYVYEAASHHTI